MHRYIESSMCLQWAGNAFKIDRISRLEKIGMADMLYSILPRLCGLIRQNMRVYAHKIPLFRNKIPFVIGAMIIN